MIELRNFLHALYYNLTDYPFFSTFCIYTYVSDRSDLHMTDSLLIAVHAFTCHILMSFSGDEMLLLRYVNLSICFRDPPFSMEMSPLGFWLKHMYSILTALTWRPVPPVAFSRLNSRGQSILQYGCTTWMLTKHIEKKFDSNCTRMLQAVMNKSWKQHPTK